MKYIIIEEAMTGTKVPVMVGALIRHDEVVSCLTERPVSAGFYNPKDGAYGRSESLGLDSAEGNTEIIEKLKGL